MRHVHRLAALVSAITVLAAPVAARAQWEAPPPRQAAAPQPLPPASAQPMQNAPSSAPTANGEYVAPIYQQTQPTYLPQSVAMSGPRVIPDYQEGDAVPYGYHPQTRIRKGLVVGGASMFGALWLLSAAVAAGNADAHKGQANPAASLWIPCIGPFLQMGHSDSSTASLYLMVDGIGQTAGVAMIIFGLASPKTVLVRNDLATVRLTPMYMGRGAPGLGLVGTF